MHKATITLYSLLLIGLTGIPAHAGPIAGQYRQSFPQERSVCIADSDLAVLKPTAWANQMKQRGKRCTLGKDPEASTLLDKWTGACTTEQGVKYDYSISVSHIGQDNLVIDSKIEKDGKLEAKTAFMAQRTGTCTAGSTALNVWELLDLPDTRAAEAVASDLLYCGALYTGLASKTGKEKRLQLSQLGQQLFATATGLLPDNPAFVQSEMSKAADRAAADIVGANAEKLYALSQSALCAPYLAEGGV
ncbi:hypothetical protein, partial [Chitinimonas sp.]|uniref:hypothetical protein n=1 Tax=Chitinimonas sp. TaxID=1934313 RepID=UPI0035ADF3D3